MKSTAKVNSYLGLEIVIVVEILEKLYCFVFLSAID